MATGRKNGRPFNRAGPYDLGALSRIETLECIKALKKIRDNEDAPAAARVKACEVILDRGWGKPTQMLEMNVRDDRAPSEMTRDELVAAAAQILAGQGKGDPGGTGRPN